MEWEEHLRTLASDAKRKRWALQTWRPSPALVQKTEEGRRATKFTGQKYDPAKWELVQNGWDHDHCLFCSQSICNCGSKNCDPEGFTDGKDWVCKMCHEKYLKETTGPNEAAEAIGAPAAPQPCR